MSGVHCIACDTTYPEARGSGRLCPCGSWATAYHHRQRLARDATTDDALDRVLPVNLAAHPRPAECMAVPGRGTGGSTAGGTLHASPGLTLFPEVPT